MSSGKNCNKNKRTFFILLTTFLILLCITACGNAPAEDTASGPALNYEGSAAVSNADTEEQHTVSLSGPLQDDTEQDAEIPEDPVKEQEEPVPEHALDQVPVNDPEETPVFEDQGEQAEEAAADPEENIPINDNNAQAAELSDPPAEESYINSEDPMETSSKARLKIKINGTEVAVTWKENESVAALAELALEAPITIQMSMYGGFEQVGPLGTAIPRNDTQTTTSAGDIVLYSGNQIVVFYGSNSWAYTRLGHIELSAERMSELLGNGDVSITIYLSTE